MRGKFLSVFAFVLVSTSVAYGGCKVPEVFKDNKDGTVTDTRTGLMWKKCAETTRWDASSDSCQEAAGGTKHNVAANTNYAEALQAAQSSTFLGHRNWRLPTAAEFQSVFGNECNRNSDGSPGASRAIAMNLRRSSGSDSYYGTFWTGTIDSSNSDKVRVASVDSGDFLSYAFDSENYTRLVRVAVRQAASKSAEQGTGIEDAKRRIRAASIVVGDTIIMERAGFKWMGVVTGESVEEYQVKLTEINTGKYLHINSGPCTSDRIDNSDVGKIIRTGKSCVKKWQ